MGKKRKNSHQNAPAIDPMKWAETFLPTAELKALESALQVSAPISIRINTLKSEPKSFAKKLSERYGWEMQPIPFCESGYWIQSPQIAPSSTIEHRMGYYYIQEAASMLPSELFELSGKPHPLILDMAASPGGKTIHIIDKTQDKGCVIANDASRSRIPALRVVLENWGAVNQSISNLQGEWFGWAMPETFDAILLDAPCSMQGLRTSASHKSRTITASEIDSLAGRQVNLLASALRAVKTGGEVVYSTCTLSPQENEGVLAQIIDMFKDAVEIVNIQEELIKPAPALQELEGKKLPNTIQRAARLWPHIFGTAGFFSAKIKKLKPITDVSDQKQQIQSVRPQGRMISDGEQEKIIQMISDQFGFDLRAIKDNQQLEILDIKGELFLVSHQLHTHITTLPILFQGMALGKPLPSGWQPSHAFMSRFGDQFTKHVFILDDIYFENWMRGEDIKGITGNANEFGDIVVVRDKEGRNLGRGKVLKDRLKNQLPTRLF